MLRNLFFTFVSVALPQVFFTYVPTQAFAVDFVSLTDIADNPDAFMGKTLITKALLDEMWIRVKNIKDVAPEIDGALLIVKDSTRKGSENFGNNLTLIGGELNIVVRNKKMARDLKDALEKFYEYKCTCTVSLEKRTDRYGKEYPIMTIHAVEFQKGLGADAPKVRIAEDK